MSEGEYLDQEIADAKAALSISMNRLKNSCVESFGLSHWIRNHIWAALGFGAIAGFAAARVLTQKASDRDFEVFGAAATGNGGGKEQPETASYGSKKSRVARKAFGAIFDLSKLFIEAALVAALRSELEPQVRAGDDSKDYPTDNDGE
jgi:hypothetical protein